MRDDLTPEDVQRAVDREVEALLESAHCATPPVDAITLARARLGVVVTAEQASTRGHKAILARREPNEETLNRTAAQVLGEALKGQVLERLGVSAGERRPLLGQSLTNLFAQRLLVPT